MSEKTSNDILASQESYSPGFVCMLMATSMPRRDSFGEFALYLPHITSLSKFQWDVPSEINISFAFAYHRSW